jgi:pseudaminic acid biosynthesis-associated methylase
VKEYTTDQEKFWESDFGDEYIARNKSDELHASNLNFFSNILKRMDSYPASALELGANVGMNVKAILTLSPKTAVTAVEINAKAIFELKNLNCEAVQASILEYAPKQKFDLVFTKGVLIHINPNELHKVYNLMYSSSNKYILVAEYYNPSPVSVTYRGIEERLFKRDFAGEMLEMFPDLKLVDYEFCYHNGVFPQDDITWFLLEKLG